MALIISQPSLDYGGKSEIKQIFPFVVHAEMLWQFILKVNVFGF